MKKISKKIWDKGISINPLIEKFTVGQDQELDILLAPFDVLGSIAHIIMLESVNLLTAKELALLKSGLLEIYHDIEKGKFKIDEGVEDVHSQIELILTRKLGEVGEKIHCGRSRNDQALLDIRLYIRDQLQKIVTQVRDLFALLIDLSEKNKDILMPGYTHLQVAMPSSFGLWFGAYAESFIDDLIQIQSAYKIINKNPLGSAAGYGSSFPLDRMLTTKLLGFDNLNYNSIYAQMGRGKSERVVSQALTSLAETIGKMSMDISLFVSQNFNFISFPESFLTGSSIMPHKKNPDLFEILRSKCNRIKSLPNEMMMITTNLPSGYHRDYQLLKEHFLPVFEEISTCIKILKLALGAIQVNKDILNDDKYKYLFSVDAVNQFVMDGLSFREAYKRIGRNIEEDKYSQPQQLHSTHEGSIGNLSNNSIEKLMDHVYGSFEFERMNQSLKQLIRVEK